MRLSQPVGLVLTCLSGLAIGCASTQFERRESEKKVEAKVEKAMTIEQFQQVTMGVVSKDGIEGYLPTIVDPISRKIRVVEGIPSGVDHRAAIQETLIQAGMDKQEFFFGVRSDKNELTVGHHLVGKPTSFLVTSFSSGKPATRAVSSVDWWTIDESR